ncbi:hypothetical protein TB2_006861 [Malus domestica]
MRARECSAAMISNSDNFAVRSSITLATKLVAASRLSEKCSKVTELAPKAATKPKKKRSSHLQLEIALVDDVKAERAESNAKSKNR